MSSARKPAGARLGEGVLEDRVGLRVLAAQVDEALSAVRRVCRDRHRLDHRIGVALEQEAILERSGLGLVCVADQVVGLRRLARDGFPLDSHRERGASPSQELRVLDLPDDELGADVDGPPQRGVATVRPVVVEAPRVDAADPPEKAQAVTAGLGCRRVRIHRDRPAGERVDHAVGGDGREDVLLGRVAGHGKQGRRSPIALAEAWAPQPGRRLSLNDGVLGAETLFERRDQLVRAVTATGQVVADVHDPRRPPLEREQRVERRDAVRVGRRHGETLADVVERAGAEPADMLVNRLQDGEQEVAPGSRAVATVRNLALVVDLPHTAFPARGGGAEHAVDRRPLGGGGHGVEQVDVHGPIVPRHRCASARSRRFLDRPSLLAGCGGDLLDPDRGRLELGRARLRIRRVDGQHVRVDLVGEVQRHEREARPQ